MTKYNPIKPYRWKRSDMQTCRWAKLLLESAAVFNKPIFPFPGRGDSDQPLRSHNLEQKKLNKILLDKFMNVEYDNALFDIFFFFFKYCASQYRSSNGLHIFLCLKYSLAEVV